MTLAHDATPHPAPNRLRHDWTRAEIADLFALPLPELMFCAAQVHRHNFEPTEVQISTLLWIKTGGCSEDCGYCPQSAHYHTNVRAEKLMSLDAVLAEARAAKAGGASPLRGILWQTHHHAHVSGSPRHPQTRARRRHPCLLRWHRRHG